MSQLSLTLIGCYHVNTYDEHLQPVLAYTHFDTSVLTGRATAELCHTAPGSDCVITNRHLPDIYGPLLSFEEWTWRRRLLLDEYSYYRRLRHEIFTIMMNQTWVLSLGSSKWQEVSTTVILSSDGFRSSSPTDSSSCFVFVFVVVHLQIPQTLVYICSSLPTPFVLTSRVFRVPRLS